jgi:hypothetical protein
MARITSIHTPDQIAAEPVDRPDEAHHEIVGRVLVEITRLARLLDTAMV